MGGDTVSRVDASQLARFPARGPRAKPTPAGRTTRSPTGAASGSWIPSLAPVTTALGVLGMPGMTAWTGLMNIGQPKPGETVVVAAASGAVGSVVGQLAKIKGCRAVGIAGGEKKCRYVVEELGFDACVDHRRPNFAEALKAACPKGIDVYFENVGGPVFDAVLPLLNTFARVPVCGLIAHYNDTEPPKGPDRVPMLMSQVLVKRLTLRGFIVLDFAVPAERTSWPRSPRWSATAGSSIASTSSMAWRTPRGADRAPPGRELRQGDRPRRRGGRLRTGRSPTSRRPGAGFGDEPSAITARVLNEIAVKH